MSWLRFVNIKVQQFENESCNYEYALWLETNNGKSSKHVNSNFDCTKNMSLFFLSMGIMLGPIHAIYGSLIKSFVVYFCCTQAAKHLKAS